MCSFCDFYGSYFVFIGGVCAFLKLCLPANVQGDTITCVGPSLAGLRTFRKVVLACIVEDLDPAYLIRKESKRKLKESINCLLA